MVLNLETGVPQLTIDAGMEIYGLRVIEETVVVAGDGKVISWSLPAGGCVPGARVDQEGSTRVVDLGDGRKDRTTGAAISSNFSRIAITTVGFPGLRRLYVYDGFTGEYVWHNLAEGNVPWFAPSEWTVWCAVGNGDAEVWGGHGQVVSTVRIEHPPAGYPWASSRGYRVTNDWWILDPDGKRLLMLPPPWQSYAVRRVWKGKFLALLHGGLSEPVILEVEP